MINGKLKKHTVTCLLTLQEPCSSVHDTNLICPSIQVVPRINGTSIINLNIFSHNFPCTQEFNMSILAAYMRPRSRSEIFKVGRILLEFCC